MAVTPIDSTGATIKLKAKAGSADAVEMECVDGDISIDFGNADVSANTCLKGITRKSKGVLKYGEGNLNGVFQDDDGAQTLLLQALKNEGDFSTDHTLSIEIEFANSKGSNGTKVSFDVLVSSLNIKVAEGNEVSMEVGYSQTTEPVITAAA